MKVGIIGNSSIARNKFIPALRQISDISEIVIATESRGENHTHNNHYMLIHGYLDDSLLDCDFVYVSLPNSFHYEVAKHYLSYGVSVLCEKPIAFNLREVNHLISVAESNNCILSENFQFIEHLQFKELVKIINSKEIGEVLQFNSRFSFPPFADASNIRYSEELLGGALNDAGCYPLRAFVEFIDESVSTEILHTVKEYDDFSVDIYGSYSLRSGSTIFNGFYGFNSTYVCDYDILGTDGRIFSNRLFTAPEDMEVIINIEHNTRIRRVRVPPCNHFLLKLSKFINCLYLRENNDEYKKIKLTYSLLGAIRNG